MVKNKLIGLMFFVGGSFTASHAQVPIELPTVLNSDFIMQTGETYLVTGNTEVRPGTTVTMQPGSVLKICDARLLTVRGALVAAGTGGNPAYIANGEDDAIGAPTSDCPSFGASTIEFDSTELSSLTNLEVSRTDLRLVGESPLDLDNVYFNPLTDYEGAISGPLAPNLRSHNVSFSSRVTEAGYYVTENTARSGDIMRDLSMPYLVWGSIEVPGDVTLAVEAGVVFKMRGGLIVRGALQVAGLPDKEVIFSGASDNRHGGAVNTGFSGSFSGIYFGPQSHSSSINHAVLANTSSSGTILEFEGSSPVITNLLLDAEARSTSDFSPMIDVSQEAEPSLSCLTLRSTSSGAWSAIRNANAVASVTASEVYWNDPRGPTLAEGDTLGAKVIGDVEVAPIREAAGQQCTIDPPSSLLIDIDGDGTINPVIDGLLITRYMAGLRGDDLIDQLVIPSGSARRSGAQIESYLGWMVARSAR